MSAKSTDKAQQTKNDLSQNDAPVDGGGGVVACKKPTPGAIRATVNDEDGTGVDTIQITASGAKPTAGGGVASFDNLAPGKYTVTITTPLPAGIKDDYAPPQKTSKQVTVKAGQTVPVVFEVKHRPTPTISVDDPKIVIVKHDYHGKKKPGVKAHRIPVKLGYDGVHDGVGELSCDHADQIKVFEKENDTKEKALPWSIKASKLKTTVYLEGAKESAAVAGTELKLTLKNGTVPPKVDSATEKITCVLLQLDIYKARPVDNSDPVIVTEAIKLDPGRPILVQGTVDTRLWAQRAKMVVAKAKPYDYAGNLVLKPITADGVVAFLQDKEVPAPGQVALSGAGLKFANGVIDQANGTILWVQGKTQSAAMSDTGWKVELEEVADKEGDRVTMTVLKAELALYKSRTAAPSGKDRPAAFSDDNKFDEGRYIHWQDDGFHHGRAMIVVKKVQPDGFVGTLTLTGFDAAHLPTYTSTAAAPPKVKIFTKEVAATGQAAEAFPFEIAHSAKYPVDGNAYWVEGGTVSGALRDAELRLGVKEVDIGCDRVEFTVVKFKKIKADIPTTPPNQARNAANGGPANGPVTRHELLMANPPAAANYAEDFTSNEPLVLIEDSVQNADPINFSVEIEPAGLNIPVKWSKQRDKSKTGDDSKIKAFKGNDDLTLTQDGADPLKATLLLDNVGSFFIRPFIDCNDSNAFEYNTDKGVRIDREPFIIMTLVVIRVVGVANNCVRNSAAFDPAKGGPGIVYQAGVPAAISTGDFAGTGNDAVKMDVTARVIGGGPKGLRGLDKLFSGWLNNEMNAATSPGPGGFGEDVTHEFQRPIPPPPPVVVGVIPPPLPPPPPIIRTRCFWQLDGAEISGPVLDSGAYGAGGTEGTGGNTCTGTAATNDNPVTKTADRTGIGQRWQVTNVDSPGGGILATAPTDALATVRRFKFNINFQCALVFWTNRNGVSGPDDFPACRLYVTVQTNNWNVRLESTFDDAYVQTVVTRKTVTFNPDGNATRQATPVAGTGLETRRPDGLDQLQADQVF